MVYIFIVVVVWFMGAFFSVPYLIMDLLISNLGAGIGWSTGIIFTGYLWHSLTVMPYFLDSVSSGYSSLPESIIFWFGCYCLLLLFLGVMCFGYFCKWGYWYVPHILVTSYTYGPKFSEIGFVWRQTPSKINIFLNQNASAV